MRLGVAGMIPADFTLIDQSLLRKIKELGFSGVGVHLGGEPQSVSTATVEHMRAMFAEQDVTLVQFWGQYQSIISVNEATRQAGIETAQAIVRLGAQLGAQMIGIRPTSLNPKGDWWPHPENFAQATEDRLVQSLQEISAACEIHGIPIALECHVTTTLDSPKSVKRIIERTESQWIKVNLDPVNFIHDLRTAYDSAELINQVFDSLAPYIAAAHIKDVYVEDRHVVHISETIPGDGLFDFDTFFRRFEKLMPAGYGLIEHLPESQISQAATFVSRKLQTLHIPILAG